MVGRVVVDLNLGLETPLSVESSVSSSAGSWKMNIAKSSADNGGLAWDISEGSLRVP